MISIQIPNPDLNGARTSAAKITDQVQTRQAASAGWIRCSEDAKAFCRACFAWYNQDHHHAGLGLMTPNQVHYGQADAIHAARQQTLDRAFAEHPERFVKQPPRPPHKPVAAWINPPHPTAKPYPQA